MKMIKFLACLSFAALAVGCSGEDDHGTKVADQQLVNFNTEVPQPVFVFSGTGFTEYDVTYGTTAPVSGTHTVSLVVDTEASTAVEGTDFVIETPTDELTSGESGGSFKIKFLEDGAVEDGKTLVLKLQSDTLDNAIFNQTYTVNVSLTCPVETFLGDFTDVTFFYDNFYDNAESQHTVSATDVENQFIIQDFWPDNADAPNFIVNYNPSTFAITFPEQNTGLEYDAGKFIYAKQSATISSYFNPCTREMHLGVQYYVPGVGSYGDKDEVFNGI